MARNLLEPPRSEVPLARVDGNAIYITQEWLRYFEEVSNVVQAMADSLDTASGSASGATTDIEWNAFVNAVKQD